MKEKLLMGALLLSGYLWAVEAETDTLNTLRDDPFMVQLDSLLYADYFAAGPDSTIEDSSVLAEGPEVPDSVIAARPAVLDKRTPLALEYNEHVARFIDVYANNRRQQVARMMGLAELYFPLFEEVLDKYDMPLELKYLAIVESALNPRAKSRVGATGLWQFMYSTGKIYGLEVSSYVDERSDPVASTEAAAQFMTKLYESFGDWNLVLAAYNSGPGNVSKAIRRSGGKRTYREIRPRLPRETRGYVPAFIAANYIMNYAEEHGIYPLVATVRHYDVDTVVLKRLMTFDQLSVLLQMPKSDLELLNPQYELDIIPIVDGKLHALTLPREKVGLFVSHEDSLYRYAEVAMPGPSLPEYVEMNDRGRYRVKSGDYLGRIAIKYGCSVRDIQRWNNLRGTNIRMGQYLTVYARNVESIDYISGMPSPEITGMEETTATAPATTTEAGGGVDAAAEVTSATQNKAEPDTQTDVNASAKAIYYTVQSGDTLWDIAKRYDGVSPDQIKKWNNISSARSLKPGIKLKLNSAS
ncbi:MAG: LysM peptidoglycan-binding domain-containing protein [Flavobacteriales bacterium]|nr:LysM peptidoglycan-binding domain-containing protein [Flavobacteriales bacterium]